MNCAVRGLILSVCASALYVPAQQAARSQQPAGLETDWDIAVVLNEISAQTTRLLPLLDHADSNAWIAKGAPDAYARQLQGCKEQVRASSEGSKALAQSPERLSAGLELFFRLQGVENMLGSIEEALRKYQSPADAQALVAMAAQNDANRDRFQQYLVNLAAEREKEYQVMDKEAQRCRGILTAPAPPTRKK
jgi:hypothetical protein